jgi:hypothetical protein
VNPWRRTMAILLAALGATIALGLPAGASERDTSRAADSKAPRVVHTGPECFAGATPQQVSPARGD